MAKPESLIFRTFVSLGYHDYRLVWLGSVTEHFGEWMELAALRKYNIWGDCRRVSFGDSFGNLSGERELREEATYPVSVRASKIPLR